MVSLLLSLFRAIPALVKLADMLDEWLREREARQRLDAKNAQVDLAIAAAQRMRDEPAGEQPKADGTPGVSGGSHPGT
jgi:hypothetical protein